MFDCVFVCLGFYVSYEREGGGRELAAGALSSACIHIMLMYSIYVLSSKFTRVHSLNCAFSVLEIEDMNLVQLLTVFSLFCFPDCL